MQIIPFQEASNWKMEIALTGEIFILWFKWNALNKFWTMGIYDSNEIPLIIEIKIVPSYPLLLAYSVFGQPQGEIVCHNIVGTKDEIGRFDMSQKFELVYYEPEEIEALRAK